ncbi:MAG: galactose-1-phosphate uridylyltransferase [Patescibacteria group bacterium]
MEIESKTKNSHSELRQDIVTGDWVVIATGRAKRPEDFSKSGKGIENQNLDDIEGCLFCDPESSGQGKDVLIYKRPDGDWSLRVFPNKFPAFSQEGDLKKNGEGPYFSMDGTGYHEVIATRDHFRHMPLLEEMEIAEVFDAYQDRYLDLMNRRGVNYISIFHNHGEEVGASIIHPHSQLMAIPVVSPYVELELQGSEKYHKSNKECAYCLMVEYESEHKERVIFENDEFIAFCPFASRAAFEVWVMPKKHKPYFERITQDEKIEVAEVFKKAMNSIYKALNNPPYNFYIHTSPCDGKDYPHYHWHIEILPHTAIWAGFELQTGIEISTIQPEVAADYLRKQL